MVNLPADESAYSSGWEEMNAHIHLVSERRGTARRERRE
jgi:hypothetical protein